MSASSKKKLRNAEQAEKMTEKQLAEQKEARKLKTYSIVFVAVLVLMICFAVYTAVSRTITGSGMRERNTVAVTVGEHEISNAELNYYFVDAVNSFYSTYGNYASLFGLDVSKPLNEQTLDEESGMTWADDFTNMAIESVKAVYALNDEAAKEGYTLSDAEQTNIDYQLTNLGAYATMYGFEDTEAYLKAMYGNGATEEGFRRYFEMTALADSFQSHYAASLVYEDADLRAAEAENYAKYSSFSYNSYYLSASSFLKGGTTDENGNTTYSDEEQAAAVEMAETTAKNLAESTGVEELDAAIAALPMNAETEGAASTAYTDHAYANINSTISDWLTSEDRQAGDITYIESVSTSTDEDGNTTETVSGYYVVLFNGSNDNTIPLVNVRHILIPFEGGTTDSTTGTTVYSDEEKAAALAEAEAVLESWKNGEATEDSFAVLANENSADSDGTDGGLYENVYPGQMVTNFNDWCFEEGRETGDTGIVESTYGYHVMFFSGKADTTYRDYMIRNELVSADSSEWYNALVEAAAVTEKNTEYLSKDLVIAG